MFEHDRAPFLCFGVRGGMRRFEVLGISGMLPYLVYVCCEPSWRACRNPAENDLREEVWPISAAKMNHMLDSSILFEGGLNSNSGDKHHVGFAKVL